MWSQALRVVALVTAAVLLFGYDETHEPRGFLHDHGPRGPRVVERGAPLAYVAWIYRRDTDERSPPRVEVNWVHLGIDLAVLGMIAVALGAMTGMPRITASRS